MSGNISSRHISRRRRIPFGTFGPNVPLDRLRNVKIPRNRRERRALKKMKQKGKHHA